MSTATTVRSYKRRKDLVEEVKLRQREEFLTAKKENRAKLLLRRRYKFDEILLSNEARDISIEEIKESSALLKEKTANPKKHLQLLRRAFALGADNIEAFFSVGEGLWHLVGFLSRSGVEQQLEACWCITNISAVGRHDHVIKAVKAAGPYLVTFLTGDNVRLKTQCAWTLGNMSSDGDGARAILIAQGVMPALVDLLEVEENTLVEAVSFALSNLVSSYSKSFTDTLRCRVLKSVKFQLNRDDVSVPVVCELSWMLVHFMADPVNFVATADPDLIAAIVAWLQHFSCADKSGSMHYYAVTPLLRVVGNLLAGGNETEVDEVLLGNSLLLDCLCGFLDCKVDHVVKECLWVMANAAACPTSQNCITTLKAALPKVTHCMARSRDIRKEAAIYICNVCAVKTNSIVACIQCGAFAIFMEWFRQLDGELIAYALKFTEMLLRHHSDGRRVLEAVEGEHLLGLLARNDHRLIRDMAGDLLQRYYHVTPS